MMLDFIALGSILLILVLATASIALLGSTPGKIARRRGHPWPEAVEAASWVGLVSVLGWPLAFVWAFLPLPARSDSNSPDTSQGDLDAAKLQERIAALEAKVEKLQTDQKEGTA
jgi:hypothetical protein